MPSFQTLSVISYPTIRRHIVWILTARKINHTQRIEGRRLDPQKFHIGCKVKVNMSLRNYVIRHYAMKTYGGVEV
jgi:hypothetical protein